MGLEIVDDLSDLPPHISDCFSGLGHPLVEQGVGGPPLPLARQVAAEVVDKLEVGVLLQPLFDFGDEAQHGLETRVDVVVLHGSHTGKRRMMYKFITSPTNKFFYFATGTGEVGIDVKPAVAKRARQQL